jgi:glycosyltransferase involved in cell wall biosynthesis
MAEALRQSGVEAERLEIIPPGVFERALSAEEPQEDFGGRTVAYSGNLDPYQDLSVLIDAIAIARRADPGIRLQVLTHAPSPRLALQVRELGLEDAVKVCVIDSYDRVQTLLRQADLLVCPRSSWSGFPIKLLNYMSAGVAMIVAAGAAKSLGEGPWITVPDNDAVSLSAAILTALDDAEERSRLSAQAQRVVREQYDWGRLALRFEALYGRLLETAPAAA